MAETARKAEMTQFDDLVARGVILGPDHFVLGDGYGNPGHHSSHFISAAKFYDARDLLHDFSRRLADRVAHWRVESIVSPDDQSLPVARLLGRLLAGTYRVPAVPCFSMESDPLPSGPLRVMIHDDVVSRGRQATELMGRLRERGIEIVGISCLFRRIDSSLFGEVPIVAALAEPLVTYPAAICPLCRAGVPVNTDFGKGRFFQAQQDEPAGFDI